MDSTLQWLREVCAATAHLLFYLFFCIFVCFYWFMLHKSIKKTQIFMLHKYRWWFRHEY